MDITRDEYLVNRHKRQPYIRQVAIAHYIDANGQIACASRRTVKSDDLDRVKAADIEIGQTYKSGYGRQNDPSFARLCKRCQFAHIAAQPVKQCEATTVNGDSCTIRAQAQIDNHWYCHIHRRAMVRNYPVTAFR